MFITKPFSHLIPIVVCHVGGRLGVLNELPRIQSTGIIARN